MAWYTYTLQEELVASGTIKIELVTDTNAFAAHIPVEPTLGMSDELREAADLIPGSIELPEIRFEFVDDYSYYPEGFWYKFLTGTAGSPAVPYKARIRITFTDSVTAHFFYGTIVRETIDLEEPVINTMLDLYVRKGEFRCVSLLSLLQETTTYALIAEMQNDTHSWGTIEILNADVGYPASNQAPTIIMLKNLLALMLAVSGINDDYDADDVEIMDNADTELLYYGTNPLTAAHYGGSDSTGKLSEIAYWLGYYSYPATSHFVWDNNLGAGGWTQIWPDLLSFLAAICRTHCVAPRLIWNTVTSRCTLQILSRGRPDSEDLLVLPDPIKSRFLQESDTKASGFSAYLWGFGSGTWRYLDQSGYGQAPGWAKMDMTADLVVSGSPEAGLDYEKFHLVYGGRIYIGVDIYKWWDYLSGAYGTSTHVIMSSAVAGYYYNLLAGSRRVYERDYDTLVGVLGAISSQYVVQLFEKTEIDDGVDTREFYASEIRKDPAKDLLSVRWIEV